MKKFSERQKYNAETPEDGMNFYCMKRILARESKNVWLEAAGILAGVIMGVLLGILLTLAGSEKEIEQETIASESFDNNVVLDDDGWFGYTEADFKEAVLQSTSREKKLIVYTANLSDTVMITDTGLAKLKIFSKTQYILYKGSAVYTVNLSEVANTDILLDKDAMTLTVHIPHAQQEKINTPAEDMEIQDTERGLLAFGDLKLTAEDYKEVEMNATEEMEKKLTEIKANETADRFAILSVWEILQPVVSELAPQCRVIVEWK